MSYLVGVKLYKDNEHVKPPPSTKYSTGFICGIIGANIFMYTKHRRLLPFVLFNSCAISLNHYFNSE